MKKNIQQINIENYDISVSRSTSNGMKNIRIQKNSLFTNRNNQSGFTLVETLFAVLILTFTITGLMTIVANSLFSARYTKDEITVNYLMQEVIDYTRNDRDTALVRGDDWDTFVSHYNDCTTLNNGCFFNVSNPSIQSCKMNPYNGVCPFLYYDNTPNGSFYNYDDTNTKTNFKRTIFVDKSELNPDELIVKVEVEWKNGSLSISRILSASFLNWKK